MQIRRNLDSLRGVQGSCRCFAGLQIKRTRKIVEGDSRRSAGGQRQYYQKIHGLVYAVDSYDRDRIEEANEELIKMMNEDETAVRGEVLT